jgi:hypothetical protein
MFHQRQTMKKVLYIITIFVFVCSCSVSKYYNDNLATLIPEKQLKSDVDYLYKKLQRQHPNLYWYITKNELDNKFDSLKASITKPMNSRDFYMMLSPVVASVRQGHTFVFPPNKILKNKENEVCKKYGTTPLTPFEFESFDNKLYIVKNNSKDTSIAIGTEVVSVNNVSPINLVDKYKNNFASDGFNQTFKAIKRSKGFPSFFYFENDITDSIRCELKFNDTVKTVCLRRVPAGDTARKSLPSKKDRLEQANKEKKEKYLGYNKATKKFSKDLNFYEPDSSVALMKLNDFMQGQSKRFFHETFKQLSSLKTKTLIIDLRDNPGGKLEEINNLYSYLVDSDYYFINKAAVVSKTSILKMGYFNGIPIGTKIARAAFYPLYFGIMTVRFFKVRKDKDNKYYYYFAESKLQHPQPESFKGNIYVLINGGSFSASCILSSNLKATKRATFVGSETGGAFNGTVAGIMPSYTLPHSKIRVRFGLLLVQPHYKTGVDGRGIFPDVEITPTLEDRIKGRDPELNWVLEKVRAKK